MSLSTLVKHTTAVFNNTRMLTSSISSSSGGWGRSYINQDDNIMHNYSIYVNFGPLVTSGTSDDIKNILVNVVQETPKYTKTISKTRLQRSTLTKQRQIEIDDRRLKYYTYS